MKLHVRPFVSSGFGQNGYLAWRDGVQHAVAIDPGDAAAAMLDTLTRERLSLDAVLLTHAHIDHLQGVARVVRETGAPVYLHPADRSLYDNAAAQGAMFGLQVDALPPIDHELADGTTIDLGDVRYAVRHAPGHSPGHVVFFVEEAGCAFVGDVVFQSSIGRSDLPGGDHAQLMQSIRTQVLTLPAETVLHTGHGPATTVGHEAATNPFLVPHYGGGLA